MDGVLFGGHECVFVLVFCLHVHLFALTCDRDHLCLLRVVSTKFHNNVFFSRALVVSIDFIFTP